MTKGKKDAEEKEKTNTESATKKIEALEKKLSKVVGLKSLKTQLRSWAKQILLDERRRSIDIDVRDINPPHMVFLGNSGTGKTTVARMFGELLFTLGLISNDKVVEVHRTDLVANYVNQTAHKTKEKIKEAKGGVLFIDEAYRLTNGTTTDFGKEAFEEILSFLDSGETVAIFAGYTKPMQNLMSSHEGFRNRVTKIFHFEELTCSDLAEMTLLKMTSQGAMHGFKLHPSCTAPAIENVIRQGSSEKQRKEINGGLVDTMLKNARECLDNRTGVKCEDKEALVTITLDDLTAGLRLLRQNYKAEPPHVNHLSFYS